MMKRIVKWLNARYVLRREDADLNQASLAAATYYLNRLGGATLPLDVRQNVLNYVAQGSYMGWRKHEEQTGVKRGK